MRPYAGRKPGRQRARRWVYTALAASILCCTHAAGAAGCDSHDPFRWSEPHPAVRWTDYRSSLTPAQQDVIAAVLQLRDRVYSRASLDRCDLYFAVPNGVLVMWFGDYRCGAGVMAECRVAYSLVGAPNMEYFPAKAGAPDNAPQEGLHMYDEIADWFGPIDRVARQAYAKYGVPSAWSRDVDFFDC